MLFGNRGPRKLAARRRMSFQPRPLALESRELMAVDLGGVLPPNQPNIATLDGTGKGVGLGGLETSGAAGFSVAAVGDTNGDGFDDFVIGAPTGVNVGGVIQPGTGNNSRAYLVFGSQSVTDGTTDWLSLLPGVERVGDLGQLNTTGQTNPIDGSPGFDYAGLRFLTTQTNGSQVGASVAPAGDVNGDGFADFLIGAPGMNDLNGLNPNTGRAFLVYGGTGLNSVANGTVDLDNPGAATGVTILTMGSTIANSRVGLSVGQLGGFFASGGTAPDIAIGAPNTSVAGLTSNGAVYAIPNAQVLSAGSGPLNLTQIGNGLAGVTFAGSTTGEQIGLSLSGAGNVDGDITQSNVPIDDMLIGGPNANGLAGEAFLIYGGNALQNAATVVNGTRVILTSRIGDGTGNTDIIGANFRGDSGARTGFAVSGIGDYNNDGFSDIAIGSPFATINSVTNAGQVDVLYGQPADGTNLVGTIPLFSKPSDIVQTSLTLTGSTSPTGGLAGYSLSGSGNVNGSGAGNDFIIGSPGLNGNQGGAYYIPSNPFFITGTIPLSAAESQPLAANVYTISNTPGGATAFLGSSVSGRPVSRTQTTTADDDTVPDFILGALSWNVTGGSNRNGAGGAFILEGGLNTFQTPQDNRIQVQIGVDTTNSFGPGPFIVSATTPATLPIVVISNTASTPIFDPKLIDPTTVAVNGILFSNATITPTSDLNNDGITDAIVTITPRSRLNLLSTTTNFDITGKTTAAGGAIPFRGSALISVSGGVTPVTPGTVTGGIQVGTVPPTSFTPHFGADHYVPPVSALSRLNYKAIPRAVAYQQYLPGKGWAARLYNFAHPERRFSRVPSGTVNSLRGRLPLTLDSHVFSRSKYHKTKQLAFGHEFPVIPTNRQSELYVARGRKHPKFR